MVWRDATLDEFGRNEHSLSSRRFNEIRGRNPDRIAYANWRKQNVDLRAYDLSNARQSIGKFESVSFGRLKDVEFAGTTFDHCTFQNRSVSFEGNSPTLDSVLFYDCTFIKGVFNGAHLRDVQFFKCTFVDSPTFEDVLCTGRLEINQSGDQTTFVNLPDADLRLGSSAWLNTDITVSTWLGIDWKAIGALRRLPFLQLSVVGLVLLTINTVVLDAGLQISNRIGDACTNLLEAVQSQSAVCNIPPGHAVLLSALQSISFATATFVCLFLASLIHLLACPAPVGEMTEDVWRLEHQLPKIFYRLLAQRRKAWMWICLVLYSAAAGLFAWGFGSRLIGIVSVLG